MATEKKNATIEHLDVLIVGAGVSGICMACYVQMRCPQKRFALFEGREASGGTWDLFQYPGVRSDSDMFTLGYSFHPWRQPKMIADGPSILHYLRETAAAFGIEEKIRYNYRVRCARWSSEEACWTVEAVRGPEQEVVVVTCDFLCMCTGYYDYEQGYTPVWPGIENFAGQVVHPQHWPEDLDYAGKQVVVIGSGATAVTLVPAMTPQAAHVTMLQRSPTYIVARPSNAEARGIRRLLPARLAYRLARWQSILFGVYFYSLTRRRPQVAREQLLHLVRQQLGDEYDIATHFAPTYNPWDQRLCLAPDGDFFAAIKQGKVSVVTDQIETFTEKGIRLHSGQELTADIIVTATGLRMKVMGGIQLVVDGKPVDLSRSLIYRGMMYRDIPNLASVFGYVNASWTLKCELIAQRVCRVLNYMDRHAYASCTPRLKEHAIPEEPMLVELTSGYVQRARDLLPRQGPGNPWKMHQNYLRDIGSLRLSSVNDGTMEFTRRSSPARLSQKAAQIAGIIEM